MRRSIATVCLSGTLEDKLEAAARAGFDAVELFENDLINAPIAPARFGGAPSSSASPSTSISRSGTSRPCPPRPWSATCAGRRRSST